MFQDEEQFLTGRITGGVNFKGVFDRKEYVDDSTTIFYIRPSMMNNPSSLPHFTITIGLSRDCYIDFSNIEII